LSANYQFKKDCHLSIDPDQVVAVTREKHVELRLTASDVKDGVEIEKKIVQEIKRYHEEEFGRGGH
jgi:hypothetical protein